MYIYNGFLGFMLGNKRKRSLATVATPVISETAGVISIACATVAASIYYTADGSTPNVTDTLYEGTFTPTGGETVKAIGIKADYTPSIVAEFEVPLQVATPTFSSPGGNYNSGQTVTIICATNGVSIRYTTDGSDPTSSSTQYTNPIQITKTTNIKARAYKTGWTDSSIASVIYTISNSMVYVPGGIFTMGRTTGSGDTDELPTHQVTLSSFYMGKYEVTQQGWLDIMGGNPSYFTGDLNRPVEKVSWYAILVYCNKRSIAESLTPVYTISGSTNPNNWGVIPTSSNATWNAVICNWNANGYRLPTEAEWEYTARGGTNNPDYLYAGSNTISNVAWYSSNSDSNTHTVGTKAANGLGIYDMSGNVYEWCWDWYGSYDSGTQTDPRGVDSGSNRVLRGGGWYGDAVNCRVADRVNFALYSSSDFIGFRVSRVSP